MNKTQIHKIKNYIYKTISQKPAQTKISKVFHFCMVSLIILNVLGVMLETVSGIVATYRFYVNLFEHISVFIFTLEYFSRLWCCNINPKYQNRFKYAITPLAIIDLLAILPFYLGMFLPEDYLIFKILRVMRIFRLFKLGHYSDAYYTIIKVFYKKAELIFTSLTFIFSLQIVFASLIYLAEHQVPDTNFTSIPSALYWSIITMTTVGYGDIYPTTCLGRIVAGFTAVSGVILFSLPTAILASGFFEEIKNKEQAKNTF